MEGTSATEYGLIVAFAILVVRELLGLIKVYFRRSETSQVTDTAERQAVSSRLDVFQAQLSRIEESVKRLVENQDQERLRKVVQEALKKGDAQ